MIPVPSTQASVAFAANTDVGSQPADGPAKIRVLYCDGVLSNPRVMMIANTLEAKQALLGGPIHVLFENPDGLSAYVSDHALTHDGSLNGQIEDAFQQVWPVYGPSLIVRFDETTGVDDNLSDSDCATWTAILQETPALEWEF